MGKQIIRQPNGLFAIYSSSTDTITAWDATEQEIIDEFAERAAEDARQNVRRILDHVKAGDPRLAYHQFALTWDQALEADREHGGEVWRAYGDSPHDAR